MSIAELARARASTWMPVAPAASEVVVSLRQATGIDLPADYLDFLLFSDGGAGSIPVQPWGFDSLWKAAELIQFNRDCQVDDFCPGFFGIGSSGGGEVFAFDMRGPQPRPVVCIPFIGMEPKAALRVASNFYDFVAMFGQDGEPRA